MIPQNTTQVVPSWKKASQTPGNIGVLKSKILVWDHDPFAARPNQSQTMSLSSVFKSRSDQNVISRVLFEAGAALLRPVANADHMVLDVLKEGQFWPISTGVQDVDNAMRYHWTHVGSLFNKRVLLTPSDYDAANWTTVASREHVSIYDIYAAPKWDYTYWQYANNTVFCPAMQAKSVPTLSNPIHWSIQKRYNIWQGTDYWVTFDSSKVPDEQNEPKEPLNLTKASTTLNEYSYLMAFPVSKPDFWEDRISNEAYTEEKKSTESKNQNEQTATQSTRDGFWKNNFYYKTYLMVEMTDGNDRFFIELVRGKNPRFIHVGYAAHPKADYRILMSRVLGEYNISVNDLLSKPRIRFLVRNHVGRIVITFEGHEDNPWVISRVDAKQGKKDDKETVPLVVPHGNILIHGGNISTRINFTIARYEPAAVLSFIDDRSIQMDTFNAKDRDIYLTCAHKGVFTGSDYSGIFTDPRFGKGSKYAYDCDAAEVVEIHQNKPRAVNIYSATRMDKIKKGSGAINRKHRITFRPLELKFRTKKETVKGNKQETIESYFEPAVSFRIGLLPQEAPNFPYREYASDFRFYAILEAGDIEWEGDLYVNALTPILPSFTFHVLGGEKPFQNKVDPIDITRLVERIRESWRSEDFSYIDHSAELTCYLPVGSPLNEEDRQIFSTAKKLASLHDKIFYITMGYWWDVGIGKPEGFAVNPETSFEQLITFTGVATRSHFEKSANRINMNISLKDYSWILEKQYIYNSPFFDAVSDTMAVFELAKLAGFDDNVEKRPGDRRINRAPLGYLARVTQDPTMMRYVYNGEKCTTRYFNLPGSYSSMIDAQSKTRASNGETYLSFMKKFAAMGPKTLYFDRWGVLKMENLPSTDSAFQAVTDLQSDAQKQRQQFIENNYQPKMDFFTTPHHPNFDVDKHSMTLIYNSIGFERATEDVINHIALTSASPEVKKDAKGEAIGGLIVEGYTFYEQIWDPNAEGFIGFRKPFVQSNGIFGGRAQLRNTMKNYAKMKYPMSVCSFQTYGLPGIKALDIISVDGSLFYITEISHEVDTSNNRWWMNITCEWIKPFTGMLGDLETQEINLGKEIFGA